MEGCRPRSFFVFIISIFILVVFPQGSTLPHNGLGHGNHTSARKGKADTISTTCTFCNILYGGGVPGIPPQGLQQRPVPNPAATELPDIFLGQPTTPEKYPFTVYLLSINGDQGFSCTGSIYTPYTIITAAHCVYIGGTKNLYPHILVFAGTEEKQKGDVRLVERIIPHPSYIGRWYSLVNDVALLILAKPYELNNKTIAAIDIAPDVKLPPGTNCTLSAYGSQVGPEGGDGGFLQEATMPIRPDGDCTLAYPTGAFNPNTCVCAGGNGLPRQCSGDSGGPLSCKGQDGVPKLYGIVSNSVKDNPATEGVPCSDPRPGVYTRAPSFKSWIDQNTKR